MRKVSKAFFTGLAAFLPLAITLFIFYRLGAATEKPFGVLIRRTLPALPYYPGLGAVVGLLAVFVLIVLFGFLLQAWIVRRVFRLGERLLHRMPIVRTVYGAARDLIGSFSGAKEKTLGQVVMVEMEGGMRQLGFLTRDDFSGYPEGMADRDSVAVFLPSSYEIGGVTMLVPRAAVRPIEMAFQDAMRFALTAGVASLENAHANERSR
jgi:uncharacterized membrane protein